MYSNAKVTRIEYKRIYFVSWLGKYKTGVASGSALISDGSKSMIIKFLSRKSSPGNQIYANWRRLKFNLHYCCGKLTVGALWILNACRFGFLFNSPTVKTDSRLFIRAVLKCIVTPRYIQLMFETRENILFR